MAMPRLLPALLLTSTLFAGCGSNGGGLLNPNPNGSFTLTDAVSGTVLTSSSAAPLKINASGAQFNVSEANYVGGSFTASAISWSFASGAFNVPCYVPHTPSAYSGRGPFTVSLTPDNAAPVGQARVVGASYPCDSATLSEGIRIVDGHGNSTTLYIKN